jgi:hypothetical protein
MSIPTEEGGLIAIRSYKDLDRAEDKLFGEGVIDAAPGRQAQDLRIVDALNMAFAASNIRANTEYNKMDDGEKKLVQFIKDMCKSLTGIDVAYEAVLAFIKNLPFIVRMQVNDMEAYNNLTLKKLQESA